MSLTFSDYYFITNGKDLKVYKMEDHNKSRDGVKVPSLSISSVTVRITESLPVFFILFYFISLSS